MIDHRESKHSCLDSVLQDVEEWCVILQDCISPRCHESGIFPEQRLEAVKGVWFSHILRIWIGDLKDALSLNFMLAGTLTCTMPSDTAKISLLYMKFKYLLRNGLAYDATHSNCKYKIPGLS